MSERQSFLSLALSGKAMTDEIDDYVDLWHEQPMGLSLHDYLGMNREEFNLWLDEPDMLPLIITSRKTNRSLDLIANDNLDEMRLAARANHTNMIPRLQAWLVRKNFI